MFSALSLLAALLFVDLTLANNYAIVMDTSENMKGNRLTAVRQALRSFVLDATEDTRVVVIGFGSQVKRYSKLESLSSPKNKQSLLDKIPKENNLKGSTSVPAEAIKKALKILRRAHDRRADVSIQNIVVITASNETREPGPLLNQTIIEGIAAAKAALYGIAIGSQAMRNDFMKLCNRDGSPGKVFYESEMPGQPYRIIDALIRIAQDNDRGGLQQLYSGTSTLSQNQQCIQKVTIDSSVGPNTVFYISWMESSSTNANVLDFKLKTPNGMKVMEGYSCSRLFKMCQYNIAKHAENGTWTMEVTNRKSVSPVSVSALVLSKSVNRYSIMINTKIYTTPAPYIWAEVIEGNRRLKGVNVTAIVTRPNMPPVSIQLWDQSEGDGNPPGKGAYGAYFSDISGDGWYTVYVTAIATDNEQLSYTTQGHPSQNRALTILEDFPSGLVEERPAVSIEPPKVTTFTRIQTPGIFTAIGTTQPDNTPPDYVTGLDVTQSQLTCLKGSVIGVITMTWRAPYDQKRGKASQYDIRMSTDRHSFRKNFSMQVAVKPEDVLPQSSSSLDNPQRAGAPEKLIFHCSICTPRALVFFSIKSVDASDNWSEASYFSYAKMTGNATDCPESSPTTPPMHTQEESSHTSSVVPTVSSSVIPTASDEESSHISSVVPIVSSSEISTVSSSVVPIVSDVLDVLDVIRHAQLPLPASEPPPQPALPSAGSSINQPVSVCKCVRLRIKEHVCQDMITYKGKVVEVVSRSDGQQQLVLNDVRSYTQAVPTGFNLTNPVTLIQQCPKCKAVKANRYYVFSAVLNSTDEKFYIRNNSMVRRLSQKPERAMSTLERISSALNKCT